MSWLSKVMGWDKHPAQLQAANAIGNTILTGIEASSPVAASLINVLETVGNTKLNTPASAISAVGNVALVLDPALFEKIEEAGNNVLLKAGVSQSVVDEFDTAIINELKALGVNVPAEPTTTTVP